jgi:hypothetical protein
MLDCSGGFHSVHTVNGEHEWSGVEWSGVEWSEVK